MAGIGAMLPVGVFAGAFLSGPRPSCGVSVAFGGITLALLIATIAVADGQAWGALAIALFGAGMALFYYTLAQAEPYAITSNEAAFMAFHVAVGVLALTVGYGLARGHAAPGAPVERPP